MRDALLIALLDDRRGHFRIFSITAILQLTSPLVARSVLKYGILFLSVIWQVKSAMAPGSGHLRLDPWHRVLPAYPGAPRF